MPDRPESTPDPAAVPPVIDPARFEDFPAFRETFLGIFTTSEHNTALREIGNMIFEMVLEYRDYWPDQPEGWLRSDLRALIADLRVVQGHLASIGDPDMTSPNTPQEEHHAAVAGRVAEDLRAAADALELELGPWRGEAA
jgi:hypothetical protein